MEFFKDFHVFWFIAGMAWALLFAWVGMRWKRSSINARLGIAETQQRLLLEKLDKLIKFSEEYATVAPVVLELYKLKLPEPEFNPDHSLWVFDEEERGLKAEPFFPEATKVIDTWAKRLGIQTDRLYLTFSNKPFGEAREAFWHLNDVEDQPLQFGANYFAPTDGLRFWLCPALLKFFPNPPKTLWARLDPVFSPSLK